MTIHELILSVTSTPNNGVKNANFFLDFILN